MKPITTTILILVLLGGLVFWIFPPVWVKVIMQAFFFAFLPIGVLVYTCWQYVQRDDVSKHRDSDLDKG